MPVLADVPVDGRLVSVGVDFCTRSHVLPVAEHMVVLALQIEGTCWSGRALRARVSEDVKTCFRAIECRAFLSCSAMSWPAPLPGCPTHPVQPQMLDVRHDQAEV